MVLLILTAALLAVAVLVVLGYNALVARHNRVDNAWAQVDVQLRRRHDLIPNLTDAVSGYAAHEARVLQALTEARTGAARAYGPGQQAAAEAQLGQAVRGALAVAEAYPGLRATENFQQLQRDLGETENRIAVSRQVYNDTVLTFNNVVQQVPTNVLAAGFGFRVREFYEVPAGDAVRDPVRVGS